MARILAPRDILASSIVSQEKIIRPSGINSDHWFTIPKDSEIEIEDIIRWNDTGEFMLKITHKKYDNTIYEYELFKATIYFENKKEFLDEGWDSSIL